MWCRRARSLSRAARRGIGREEVGGQAAAHLRHGVCGVGEAQRLVELGRPVRERGADANEVGLRHGAAEVVVR